MLKKSLLLYEQIGQLLHVSGVAFRMIVSPGLKRPQFARFCSWVSRPMGGDAVSTLNQFLYFVVALAAAWRYHLAAPNAHHLAEGESFVCGASIAGRRRVSRLLAGRLYQGPVRATHCGAWRNRHSQQYRQS
jgi:hypothetical protein